MDGPPVSLVHALSRTGVCSRAQARRAIEAGRVQVAGRTECRAEHRARPDQITLDGRPLQSTERRVLALHKPTGVVTTRSDPAGRLTVYHVLGDVGGWVFPVGRLDRETAGLLIFTNDAALGTRLAGPEHRVAKTYHARVRGLPAADALRVMAEGVPWPDGTCTRPARVRVIGGCRDATSWIEIAITDGRKHQVRRMCSTVGHDVLELIRVRIGALALGDLRPGEWRSLSPAEVALLCQEHEGRSDPTR